MPFDPATTTLHEAKIWLRKAAKEGGADCPCCTHYSRSYLHHLFQIGDGLALRLATLHNLRFYARLMERLRQADSQQEATQEGER